MNEYRNSNIAMVLKACGIIVGLCGFIGGVAAGFAIPIIKVTSGLFSDYHEEQYNYLLMLLCWVSGIISAAILYGFGELITIQNDNRQLLEQIGSKLASLSSTQTTNQLESSDDSDKIEETESTDEGSWICSCGTYNYPHEKICSRCGTPRHPEN